MTIVIGLHSSPTPEGSSLYIVISHTNGDPWVAQGIPWVLGVERTGWIKDMLGSGFRVALQHIGDGRLQGMYQRWHILSFLVDDISHLAGKQCNEVKLQQSDFRFQLGHVDFVILENIPILAQGKKRRWSSEERSGCKHVFNHLCRCGTKTCEQYLQEERPSGFRSLVQCSQCFWG